MLLLLFQRLQCLFTAGSTLLYVIVLSLPNFSFKYLGFPFCVPGPPEHLLAWDLSPHFARRIQSLGNYSSVESLEGSVWWQPVCENTSRNKKLGKKKNEAVKEGEWIKKTVFPSCPQLCNKADHSVVRSLPRGCINYCFFEHIISREQGIVVIASAGRFQKQHKFKNLKWHEMVSTVSILGLPSMAPGFFTNTRSTLISKFTPASLPKV